MAVGEDDSSSLVLMSGSEKINAEEKRLDLLYNNSISEPRKSKSTESPALLLDCSQEILSHVVMVGTFPTTCRLFDRIEEVSLVAKLLWLVISLHS